MYIQKEFIRFWIFVLFVAVSIGTTVCKAQTITPEEQGKQLIERLGVEVLTLLNQYSEDEISYTQTINRFETLLVQNFDLRWISRFTLGRYYRTATPAQRKEYLELFREFVVQTYISQFTNYSGQGFEVLNVRQDSRGRYIFVESRVTIAQEDVPGVDIVWRLRNNKEKNRLLIVDLEIAGVSMARTQRNEFTSLIRQNGNGVEGLLNELRRKVTQQKSG